MEINKLNARILSKFGESGAVFGVGALELVKDYPELLILSADMSMVAGLERFKNTYPDHFLIQVLQNRILSVCLQDW